MWLDDQIPLLCVYVPGRTYPADVCVLRHALESHARTRPDEIFAVFEGGERWTFAQTLEQVASLAGNLYRLGVASTIMWYWYCRPVRWRQGDVRCAMILAWSMCLLTPRSRDQRWSMYCTMPAQLIAIVDDNVLERVLEAAPATLKTVIRSSDAPVAPREGVTQHGISVLAKQASPPPPPPKPINRLTRSRSSTLPAPPVAPRGCCRPICMRFPARPRRLELPDAGRPATGAHADFPHRRRLHCNRLALRWKLDRSGQSFPYRGFLGSGSRAGNHLRLSARRDGDLSFKAAAKSSGSRPQAAHGVHRAARTSGTPFRERFGVDFFTLFNMTEICTPLIPAPIPKRTTSA